MIEKPKQYLDTRSHQLYYQWDESEYFSHQEPIYDRTREYIESLEAENAKLRELLQRTWDAFHDATAREFVTVKNELRELGIEVDDG